MMYSTNKRGTPVLVTGVGGGGVGEQIMFALRVADTPYRIIATDADNNSLGLYSADKGYLVPKATNKSYLSKVLEICKNDLIKVVIPGSEAELVKISKNRDYFENQDVLPLINSSYVIDLCRNKWKTYLFLKKNGFNAPESYVLKEGVNNIKLEYPLVIKPYLDTGGSRFVFIAQDNDELSFFTQYLRRQGCCPMVQKYVGTAENEYTVGVLTSFEGELLGSIAVKRRLVSRLSTLHKIKNYRDGSAPLYISTGVSQGIIDDFREVRENAEEIALKLGSKGPINVQCRVTDEGVQVFEINPRFSGTEGVRALAGYNAPDALIRKYILGEDFRVLNFNRGIALRGVNNYFKSSRE